MGLVIKNKQITKVIIETFCHNTEILNANTDVWDTFILEWNEGVIDLKMILFSVSKS